jgi:hypothetical protein
MTLSEMASAVRNHVADGLNGISSTSSLEQLQDEILLTLSSNCKPSAQGLLDITN